MVGVGLGITATNRINSNWKDTDVCHLPLDPPSCPGRWNDSADFPRCPSCQTGRGAV